MIFIAGATGFIGNHLVNALLADGYRLKCLVRSGKTSQDFSSKNIQIIKGDITEPDTLRGALSSDDFVVHLVGIMEEKGKATFEAVHRDGTSNLINEARRAGVRHFFYQSALGADKASWSGYLRTKAEAEEIVKNSGLSHTIFRPSLIIGPWDGFTKKLVEMLRLSPVLPIPGGGKARFQPVSIKDWLRCISSVLREPALYPGTYDIGGPERLTYRTIVETLSRSMGLKKHALSIPMGLMKLGAAVFESVLSSPPVTSDQLRLLEQDNICDVDAVEKYFGFKPMRYEDALKEFINN